MAESPASDEVRCSFCGKRQDEVLKLIAGPKVYICNECLELCNDIVAEELPAGSVAPSTEADDTALGLDHVATCLVCRQSKLRRDVLMLCPPGPVCRDCANGIRIASEVDLTLSGAYRRICGLCGETRREEALLAIPDRGGMCGPCVEAVLTAIRAPSARGASFAE